jgi:hypothetical protein
MEYYDFSLYEAVLARGLILNDLEMHSLDRVVQYCLEMVEEYRASSLSLHGMMSFSQYHEVLEGWEAEFRRGYHMLQAQERNSKEQCCVPRALQIAKAPEAPEPAARALLELAVEQSLDRIRELDFIMVGLYSLPFEKNESPFERDARITRELRKYRKKLASTRSRLPILNEALARIDDPPTRKRKRSPRRRGWLSKLPRGVEVVCDDDEQEWIVFPRRSKFVSIINSSDAVLVDSKLRDDESKQPFVHLSRKGDRFAVPFYRRTRKEIGFFCWELEPIVARLMDVE